MHDTVNNNERASRILRGSLAIVFLLGVSGMLLYGATPGSGTVVPPLTSGGTTTITWTGGPYTSAAAYASNGNIPALCNPLTCDIFNLTVSVPPTFYASNPTYQIRVHIDWQTNIGPVGDFDLYVYDASGNLVNSSTQGNTTFEEVNLDQLPSGTYQVQIIAYVTVNQTYSGRATLGPPPVEPVRSGKYKNGSFTFTSPNRLTAPNDLLFLSQDLEPRAAYDGLGNIYVAAIQGTPGGTDVWKSIDGGSSFTYLGEPDGAQIGAALAARGLAFGGGDEDIAIGTTGRVYVASLWGPGDFLLTGAVVPLAATMCVSNNGGSTWISNPYSQYTPVMDRQWLASYQENQVYLSFQQEGADLQGTNSIFCLKSFDGGITWPQITEVTTPELGIQPNFQGNIAVDQRNGYVYTVFVGHVTNELYIARSTDGGAHFTITRVYAGPIGTSVANIFPILSVDRGGNVHIVYSNGTNVFLTSSQNQGATWTVPVRVNNGTGTKTALAPWVDAGDAGKVNIIWWATSSSNSLADSATWKVYFAQVSNTFAKNPTITENAATGIFHTGPICVNGTGCAAGTRNLAEYASTTVYLDGKAMIVYPDDQQSSPPQSYFIKQTGGTGVLGKTAIAVQPTRHSEEAPGLTPNSYALRQNFPNPFNPSTTIVYTLPSESHVRLNVYNMLGSEVSILVNTRQSAGSYSVRFDASRQPSGVYYYKLTAGGFVDIKRMVVMK